MSDDTATVAAIIREAWDDYARRIYAELPDDEVVRLWGHATRSIRLALRQGARDAAREFTLDGIDGSSDPSSIALTFCVPRDFVPQFRTGDVYAIRKVRDWPEKPATPASSRTLAHVVAPLTDDTTTAGQNAHKADLAGFLRLAVLAAEAQRIAEGTP